ncbi:MAG: amidase [Proteobacteria bacterium]|nr:amidase [Pseudomonadota bacterium]MDA1022563.1 amidase [Pseudomonadota bacterium]
MPERNLSVLSALVARDAMAHGEFSAEELSNACLDRIAEREDTVGAWAFVDRELALAQARALDQKSAAGEPLGPLHGLPVGIKDIFDTSDMPTECGSAFYKGRCPLEDSAVVAILRQAGAVILGKTVTTEWALSAPGKTSNPHDPARTPGGSSSGSAAAVADAMVPLAIGTQTGGSMIRPASYCGVFGYKPTFGSISRRGMSMLARRLDTVGVYARDVEGLALIADALMIYDPQDWDMEKQPQKNLTSALVGDGGNKAPRFAFVRSPAWKQVEPDMAEAFENFIKNLGDKASEVELEGLFDDIIPTHWTIMHANVAVTLGEVAANAPDKTRDQTKERVDAGNAIPAADYIRALGRAEAQGQALDRLFDHFDAILTPSATGQAPVGLGETGKPVFNGMWTMLGVPCVSVPLLSGENSMPMGVQVIGRKSDDVKIIRCARWLSDQLLGDT